MLGSRRAHSQCGVPLEETLFRGELRSTLRCLRCGHERARGRQRRRRQRTQAGPRGRAGYVSPLEAAHRAHRALELDDVAAPDRGLQYNII